MTPTQLRTIVEVVTTGSVRHAAERLFVSPPAVSASLAALQRELGVALVQRDGRGLAITPSGALFAEYARRVLGLLDEAAAAVIGAEDATRGRVRLAAVTTAGEHVLPRFLASFRSRYSSAGISLEVGNRARVWGLLDHHEADLVIGGRPPDPARFSTLATRSNELVVVAAPAVASGRTPRPRSPRPATATELARTVWLLREPGSGTRSSALELFEEMNIGPPTLTLGSNGAIRESVQVGLGITLISRDAVARELENGDLEEWTMPGGRRSRSWHVVARAGDELPATARLFLEELIAAPDDSGPFVPVVADASAPGDLRT